MFRKRIEGKEKISESSEQASDPATEALLRAIAEKKKEDPMIGLKIGADEVLQRLLDALKNERGVHFETLLGILGSIGGFSCAVAALDQPDRIRVDGNNGQIYYLGDAINRPLLENQYSLWGIAAAGAQEAGANELPDMHEIVRHVATSLGGDDFGIPRIPPQHALSDSPLNMVRNLWPKLHPITDMFCDNVSETPILYGIAIQKALLMGKDVIQPSMALRIIMECAVSMSKLDPSQI